MDGLHTLFALDRLIFFKVEQERGTNFSQRHLLILDGHKSHISLQMLLKAKDNGIDIPYLL